PPTRACKGFPGMPEWEGPDPALRAFPWPGLFARLGISGLFVPFTGEPHLLMDGPACRFPFRSFHDVAHQRGYAREDEANFLGWWLGSHSGDPHYRYSANLVAWEYVLDALRFADPEEAHRMIQSVPEGVRDDRARLRAYWRQFEGPLEAVGTAANNVFLKSQGQSHGVASYGRMVRLLLWDFDQRRVVR
ncbi:MAG TPA: DUF3810 family protein, partial [Planctomycetota bacterium]|nr:DUF3810 family protein [Planctomycetota bacterium]